MQKKQIQNHKIESNIKKLQNELLSIQGITDVKFNLDKFYHETYRFIVLIQYDIPRKLRNYYDVHTSLKNNIIHTAKKHGLQTTNDTIDDYGTEFYCTFTYNKL